MIKPDKKSFIAYLKCGIRLAQDTKLSNNIHWVSLIYISISLLGLFLLALLTFTFSLPTTSFPLQKQLFGLIFGGICILGISAGTKPQGCSKALHNTKNQKKNANLKLINNESLEFKGHHPACGHYSTHIIHLGDKTYCAGCLGLVVGGTASLLGLFLYYSTSFFTQKEGLLFLGVGFIGVIFGLLQYYLSKNNFFHFMLNVFFVLGAFFLFIGVNIVNTSYVVMVYLLSMIVYWIVTRIKLSRLEHRKICIHCDSTFCEIKRSFNF